MRNLWGWSANGMRMTNQCFCWWCSKSGEFANNMPNFTGWFVKSNANTPFTKPPLMTYMKVGGIRVDLIKICWPQQTFRGHQFTGIWVKHRGVRFHRIRDFKLYGFNSIPPTSSFSHPLSILRPRRTRRHPTKNTRPTDIISCVSALLFPLQTKQIVRYL